LPLVFESTSVDEDDELHLDQLLPDRDNNEDDELEEVILPHDFHGLFEGLYRTKSSVGTFQ